jgi:hypothetical protein
MLSICFVPPPCPEVDIRFSYDKFNIVRDCGVVIRTVHCFWLLASERTEEGYALYLAVYVKKVNWFTPIYMALITPLLKWIIYPSMEKGIKNRWKRVFPGISSGVGAAGGDGQRAIGERGYLKRI